MQNKVLKNLYQIQNDTTVGNRLLNMIKTERLKNRLILYGVVGFLMLAIAVIVYNFIF